TMSSFGLLQVGLILSCTTKITSLHCNHLRLQQSKVIESSLRLLDKMGEKFPRQCLREKTSFRFPKQVLKTRQKESMKVAIEEIFQHIFYIFSKNLTLAGWDGQALEQFQNGLYQQIEQVGACATEKRTQHSWSRAPSRLELKRYFQQIDCFLKDRQHSRCSWEVSRAEMRRCLQFVEKVVRRL
ncbi:IFNK protein, partial [Nothocercus nigrocapillus]|nr:IFNK protein [Nothocercus nigrocapillus]